LKLDCLKGGTFTPFTARSTHFATGSGTPDTETFETAPVEPENVTDARAVPSVPLPHARAVPATELSALPTDERSGRSGAPPLELEEGDEVAFGRETAVSSSDPMSLFAVLVIDEGVGADSPAAEDESDDLVRREPDPELGEVAFAVGFSSGSGALAGSAVVGAAFAATAAGSGAGA
jgi:hypothetical protein